MALPDQAEYFFYHATLEKNSGEKIKFYGQARSLVESCEEVIAKEAFALPVITAKRFLPEILSGQNDAQMKYKVKIRSMKDEAKDDDEESGIDD